MVRPSHPSVTHQAPRPEHLPAHSAVHEFQPLRMEDGFVPALPAAHQPKPVPRLFSDAARQAEYAQRMHRVGQDLMLSPGFVQAEGALTQRLMKQDPTKWKHLQETETMANLDRHFIARDNAQRDMSKYTGFFGTLRWIFGGRAKYSEANARYKHANSEINRAALQLRDIVANSTRGTYITAHREMLERAMPQLLKSREVSQELTLALTQYRQTQALIHMLRDVPVRAAARQMQVQNELSIGMKGSGGYAVARSSTGMNASQVLRDQGGPVVLFKPMAFDRVGEIRESHTDGQGPGNEALAYSLDHYAFSGRHQVPETHVVELDHPNWDGTGLGSVHAWQPGTDVLKSMLRQDDTSVRAIPSGAFEPLDFFLLSGGTDGHFGNVLHGGNPPRLIPIDHGASFPDTHDHAMFLNNWDVLPQALVLMTPERRAFLRSIDVDHAMNVFELQSRMNEAIDPTFRMTTGKFLTQKFLLHLARAAAEEGVSQREWAGMLLANPAPSAFQRNFQQNCGHLDLETEQDWRNASGQINWTRVQEQFRNTLSKNRTTLRQA